MLVLFDIDDTASWRLFDDVLPCLDALAGHELGVVSNGQSRQQRMKLAKLGIAGRFAHAVPVVTTLTELPRLVERACGGP